jgi:hypothetical protein
MAPPRRKRGLSLPCIGAVSLAASGAGSLLPWRREAAGSQKGGGLGRRIERSYSADNR